MFRPLGLLSDVPCPDHQRGLCSSRRTECPFDHSEKALKAKRQRSISPPRRASQHTAAAAASSSSSSQLGSPSSQLLGKRQRVNAYQPGDKAARQEAKPTTMPTKVSVDGEDDEGWTTVSHKRVNKTTAALSASSGTSSSKTAAASSSSASATASSTTISRRPPTISPAQHSRTSPILLTSRNTCLKTLHDHFCIAYAPLLESADPKVKDAGHLLASQDALQQERDVWTRATKMSYRSSIVTMAVGIKKRDVEAVKRCLSEALSILPNGDANDHTELATALATRLRSLCTEVGTNAAVDEKRRSEERRIKTELSITKLKDADLICPDRRLAEFGFDVVPTTNGKQEAAAAQSSTSADAAWGAGSSEPSAHGQQKECDRCRKPFIVGQGGPSDSTTGQDMHACHYHWGKKTFERDPTAGVRHRVQVWTCCGRGVEAPLSSGITLSQLASFGGGPSQSVEGDRTCCVGPHVFKEEDVAQLHRREGFVSTQELDEQLSSEERQEAKSTRLEIVALDCELGYTTGGLSLTRVTLIDQGGKAIYDSLCRPRTTLVDTNLQFSGVTTAQLQDPTIPSLPVIRQILTHYISPTTLLVGHGLENDLRALRLLHPLLCDTALLFPHPIKGFPYRQKLKDLAYRLLGRTIQAGMSTDGHSSLEDAKASLDLVKWKLENEKGKTPWSDAKRVANSTSAAANSVATGTGKAGGSAARTVGTAVSSAQPASSSTVVVSSGTRVLNGGNGASRPVARPAPQHSQQQRSNNGKAGSPPMTGGGAGSTPSLFIPRRK